MKPADAYQELLRDLTRAIVLKTGTREQIATEYAAAAMECLQNRKSANGSVYVAAPPRQYDLLQITAALERGDAPAKICALHGLSRRQLHRLFPGGLPSRRDVA